jgi:NAD+ synthetase
MRYGKEFLITKENAGEYVKKIGSQIKDYLKKNRREGVVLGMSGGVDCSVVARLCQEAGIDVHLVLMPYQSDMMFSKSHARAMEFIQKFNFEFEIHNIGDTCLLNGVDKDHPFAIGARPKDLHLAEMNRRPRARTAYLQELAQLSRRLVIGTSNLDEISTGYFTVGGDNINGYQPLAMLTKREVYILAAELGVPDSIIDADPSAGLFEGQTDEAELGFTYQQIDDYIIDNTSGDSEVDARIEERYLYTDFKRQPIPYFNG